MSYYTIFIIVFVVFLCFKQKTAYDVRISEWSSDVCSSDLIADAVAVAFAKAGFAGSEPVINEDGTQRLTFSKDGYGRVMATVRSSDGQKFTNPDAKGVVWLDLPAD